LRANTSGWLNKPAHTPRMPIGKSNRAWLKLG
jgi:hypothetical protein